MDVLEMKECLYKRFGKFRRTGKRRKRILNFPIQRKTLLTFSYIVSLQDFGIFFLCWD